MKKSIWANLVLSPTALITAVIFYGCLIWTIYISFTSSKIIPNYHWVGFNQYIRLFHNLRWKTAIENMFVFGFLYIAGCLIIGFLLAVLIDQKIRFESSFRTAILYPLALSFIVTGLAWQWFLNPEIGLEHMVRSMGFATFKFDWLVRKDRVIYVVAISAIWHSSGLIMALMLAGLRGVNGDIWKASEIEGVPRIKTYIYIIVPMLKNTFITSTVLLSTYVIKSYDLVVSLTKGGPGFASDIPGKFIVDYLFDRTNIAFASAAAVYMLVVIVASMTPFIFIKLAKKRGKKNV